MTLADDIEVRASSADGWEIGGLLRRVGGDAGAGGEVGESGAAGAVLVPGSRHERDAYTTIADALAARGVASLRIDIRGRGASLGDGLYARMAPRQRRRVALDVATALDHLAGAAGVDADRLAVVAEQDTAADAADAAGRDRRVRAVVVLSPRHGERIAAALGPRPVPVFGLVSREDRHGLRATVDAFLAGADGPSRLEVFGGLGFGTTMLSTRQFEHADAEPLESMIADWVATQT